MADPKNERVRPSVVRVDRYTVSINGHRVRATPEQERALLTMSPEQVQRFLAVMGVTDA